MQRASERHVLGEPAGLAVCGSDNQVCSFGMCAAQLQLLFQPVSNPQDVFANQMCMFVQ